ncbi:MAG: hypothetical protein KGL39_52380 [Patescibacteria group bacterium]|nr:hypothetical protein [Patescibacteria group bacterium]
MSNESDIGKLQAQSETHDKWLRSLSGEIAKMPQQRELDQLRSDLRELTSSVNKLVEQLAKQGSPCPAPGMCIDLDKRIRNLEVWRSLIIGGGLVTWTVFGAVMYYIGSHIHITIVALVNWLRGKLA